MAKCSGRVASPCPGLAWLSVSRACHMLVRTDVDSGGTAWTIDAGQGGCGGSMRTYLVASQHTCKRAVNGSIPLGGSTRRLRPREVVGALSFDQLGGVGGQSVWRTGVARARVAFQGPDPAAHYRRGSTENRRDRTIVCRQVRRAVPDSCQGFRVVDLWASMPGLVRVRRHRAGSQKLLRPALGHQIGASWMPGLDTAAAGIAVAAHGGDDVVVTGVSAIRM